MLFTLLLFHCLQEEISSPISAQIFELCDSELFPEALQNSEVTSSSNCCYEENSSYATNISLALDVENKFNNNSNSNTVTTPTSTTTTNNNRTNSSNLSIIFDSQEELDNDISASIDFSSSPAFNVPPFLPVTNQQEQFDFSSLQPHQVQLAACSAVDGFSQYPTDTVAPLMGAPLPSVFEEDCISSVPSYVPLNPSSPSCSYLNPGMAAYMPTGPLGTALSADRAGLFGGSMLLGSELQRQELEYQGENGGIYCTDSIQRVFNPQDLQVWPLFQTADFSLLHFFLLTFNKPNEKCSVQMFSIIRR